MPLSVAVGQRPNRNASPSGLAPASDATEQGEVGVLVVLAISPMGLQQDDLPTLAVRPFDQSLQSVHLVNHCSPSISSVVAVPPPPVLVPSIHSRVSLGLDGDFPQPWLSLSQFPRPGCRRRAETARVTVPEATTSTGLAVAG